MKKTEKDVCSKKIMIPTKEGAHEGFRVNYTVDNEGKFTAKLPKKIGEVVSNEDVHGEFTVLHEDTLNGLKDRVEEMVEEYGTFLKNNSSEKVIVVEFKANVSGRQIGPDKKGGIYRNDIAFTGMPALHLSYKVLYRLGDQLHEKNGEDFKVVGSVSQYKREYKNVPEHVVMKWTQEREDFFEKGTNTLADLIERLHNFIVKVSIEPERIEEITQGRLLLGVSTGGTSGGPEQFMHGSCDGLRTFCGYRADGEIKTKVVPVYKDDPEVSCPECQMIVQRRFKKANEARGITDDTDDDAEEGSTG